MTTLYHGSYEQAAPIIKKGANALAGDNVFDGLFAAADQVIAESHGDYVYVYHVESIADNSDLDCEEAIDIIKAELGIDDHDVATEIASAVAYEESLADFAEFISPRSEYDADDFGWEMQRLRGVVAYKLGFDAVECEDEHGTTYLITNPAITGEPK